MRVYEVACVIAVLGAAATSACPERRGEIYQERTFFGFECAADCARHKAGFAWAERHGITVPAACAAIDPAYFAGCSAYATEGLAPFDAGYAWALENEIAEPILCTGGGERFHRGCRQYVDESSARKPVRCAEAWPGHAEAFPAQTVGR